MLLVKYLQTLLFSINSYFQNARKDFVNVAKNSSNKWSIISKFFEQLINTHGILVEKFDINILEICEQFVVSLKGGGEGVKSVEVFIYSSVSRTVRRYLIPIPAISSNTHTHKHISTFTMQHQHPHIIICNTLKCHKNYTFPLNI